MKDKRNYVYQLVWEHLTSRDVFMGDYWPDKNTAEWIADNFDKSLCKNLEIKKVLSV